MRTALARYLGLEKVTFRLVNPSEYAHLVIDVQRYYCDPAYSKHGTAATDKAARNIASTKADFKRAGMPTYMVYNEQHNKGPDQAFGGLHRVTIENDDIVRPKYQYSAFEYSDFDTQLKSAGVRTLLVSGFDLDCCVNGTVQDALRAGFNVWALTDCIGNGGNATAKHISTYMNLMADNGAELMTAKQAAKRLSGLTAPAAA